MHIADRMGGGARQVLCSLYGEVYKDGYKSGVIS